MKIYVVKDPMAYAVITTELAQSNLARKLKAEFKSFNGEQITNGKIDKDSSSDIYFMFHAANANISHFTTKHIRAIYPNCKIICLGTDTIWYRRLKDGHEIDSPLEVDLWLDTLDEVLEDYHRLNIKVKPWLWTLSETTIQYLLSKPQLVKHNDFIGLFKIVSNYRNDLVKFIRNNGYSFIHGGMGVGYNLDELHTAYSSSKYSLGTTSSSWQTGDIRTMKGFRDWLAPCCGTILLYDDHPDIVKKYPCPLYQYDNFDSIIKVVKDFENYPDNYRNILKIQLDWLQKNTLEIQFEEAIKAVS